MRNLVSVSSPTTTPFVSKTASPCSADHHIKEDGSPNNSPLVFKSKRRLLDMAERAEGTLASLAIKTPDKPNPDIGLKRIFNRSTTLPCSSKLTSVSLDTRKPASWETGRISAPPPSKIRKTTEESESDDDSEYNVIHSSSGERLSVPHNSASKDAIKRITPQVLLKLIKGKFKDKVDEFHIIDCRFSYEFDGGHIAGAINLNTNEALVQKYLSKDVKEPTSRQLLIFHCEYSLIRGPKMALYLRSQDRLLNGGAYPRLYFPEIYVLEGGYHDFYTLYKDQCSPQGYVEMRSNAFENAFKQERCKRGSQFLRQNTISVSSWSYTFDNQNNPKPVPNRQFSKAHSVQPLLVAANPFKSLVAENSSGGDDFGFQFLNSEQAMDVEEERSLHNEELSKDKRKRPVTEHIPTIPKPLSLPETAGFLDYKKSLFHAPPSNIRGHHPIPLFPRHAEPCTKQKKPETENIRSWSKRF